MLVAKSVRANPQAQLTAHNMPKENPLQGVLRSASVPVILSQTELELRL